MFKDDGFLMLVIEDDEFVDVSDDIDVFVIFVFVFCGLVLIRISTFVYDVIAFRIFGFEDDFAEEFNLFDFFVEVFVVNFFCKFFFIVSVVVNVGVFCLKIFLFFKIFRARVGVVEF